MVAGDAVERAATFSDHGRMKSRPGLMQEPSGSSLKAASTSAISASRSANWARRVLIAVVTFI
ncbi:hypothetical protein D3C72_2193640 [compost metagenome]